MPQRVKSDREFLTTNEACEKTGLSPRISSDFYTTDAEMVSKQALSGLSMKNSLCAFVAKPRKRGPKKSCLFPKGSLQFYH